MRKRIAWCTSHYTAEFCKQKAKELRQQGYKVTLGSYLKENGKTYCKIYLEKDINYYVLSVLEMVRSRVRNNGDTPIEAILKEKENIREICRKFSMPIRIEIQNNNVFAVINNNYELSVSC